MAMYIEEQLNQMSLPEVYRRQNVACFLDPIRKKLIQITPEEIVRQKVLAFKIGRAHV